MDILKVFETNDVDKKVLLSQGFQNSEFYNNNISLDTLFKDVINLFIENDKCLMFNKQIDYKINPQNGLIKQPTTKTTKKTTEKNITYGSDLKIILNNLVGLIGYEFSTSVLLLSLYPTIIRHFIEDIKNVDNYKQMFGIVNTINNAYNICNLTQPNNNNEMFYFNNDPNQYITELLTKIQLRISNNNNVSLESDKEECYQTLLSHFENTVFDTLYIKSIDNLCVELGKYKPCYDNYFMKMWELLLKETYADMYEFDNIYPRFITDINNDLETIELPFITLLTRYAQRDVNNYNIINNINKQIVYLKQYFKNINKKTTI